MAFVNNYSTSFRYLDFLFGTDNKYRAYKARLVQNPVSTPTAPSKDANGKASESDWKKKVEDEVEREGLRAELNAEKGGWGREAKLQWWGNSKTA